MLALTASPMPDLDCYVSQWHYIKHIAPVWKNLSSTGRFIVKKKELVGHAAALGIVAEVGSPKSESRRPVLVAGGADLQSVGDRPVALMEHGAGQTYIDSDNISYAGGLGRERVELFLCPSEAVANANLSSWPAARARVVGVPYLDEWLERRSELEEQRKRSAPMVVISFHWPARVSIESGTAWPDWCHQLSALKQSCDRRGWQLRGHGHPKVIDNLRRAYKEANIRVVESWQEVMAQASLYIVDNSSTLYEFAAAGAGKTIALRSSKWRRDVHHGLRFWDAVPCPDLEPDDKIERWLDVTMADPSHHQEKRAAALKVAYGDTLDGLSTQRAATAINDWLES